MNNCKGFAMKREKKITGIDFLKIILNQKRKRKKKRRP